MLIDGEVTDFGDIWYEFRIDPKTTAARFVSPGDDQGIADFIRLKRQDFPAIAIDDDGGDF
jgi:hypothetical protein